jgi:hypothetical protein
MAMLVLLCYGVWIEETGELILPAPYLCTVQQIYSSLTARQETALQSEGILSCVHCAEPKGHPVSGYDYAFFQAGGQVPIGPNMEL